MENQYVWLEICLSGKSMDLTNVRVAIAGTCRKFYRLTDDAGKRYMFAFMPTGMMHVSKRKMSGLRRLPIGTAPRIHQGMMLRLDFRAAII